MLINLVRGAGIYFRDYANVRSGAFKISLGYTYERVFSNQFPLLACSEWVHLQVVNSGVPLGHNHHHPFPQVSALLLAFHQVSGFQKSPATVMMVYSHSCFSPHLPMSSICSTEVLCPTGPAVLHRKAVLPLTELKINFLLQPVFLNFDFHICKDVLFRENFNLHFYTLIQHQQVCISSVRFLSCRGFKGSEIL